MSFLGDVVSAIGNFLEGVWHAIEGLFSDDPPAKTTQSCPLLGGGNALTPDQAQQWFDHFKNDRPDIPFNYPVDCCYTRAREMANEMSACGVPVQKVWNYAGPGEALRVPTTNVPPNPDGSEGAVTWVYHVAPVVPVRQPDGSIQNMVIDPSMESGPVSIDKWKADQNDPGSTSALTSSDPYYRDPAGRTTPDPGDAASAQQLAKHQAARERLWAGH
jgi:hypothetical protein